MTELFFCLHAITLSSCRQKAHQYAKSINAKKLIYSLVKRIFGSEMGPFITIKMLVSNSGGRIIKRFYLSNN